MMPAVEYLVHVVWTVALIQQHVMRLGRDGVDGLEGGHVHRFVGPRQLRDVERVAEVVIVLRGQRAGHLQQDGLAVAVISVQLGGICKQHVSKNVCLANSTVYFIHASFKNEQ